MNSTGNEVANFGMDMRQYARELDIPKYVIDMTICLMIIIFIIVASVKKYLAKRRGMDAREDEPRIVVEDGPRIVVESPLASRTPRVDDWGRR